MTLRLCDSEKSLQLLFGKRHRHQTWIAMSVKDTDQSNRTGRSSYRKVQSREFSKTLKFPHRKDCSHQIWTLE